MATSLECGARSTLPAAELAPSPVAERVDEDGTRWATNGSVAARRVDSTIAT